MPFAIKRFLVLTNLLTFNLTLTWPIAVAAWLALALLFPSTLSGVAIAVAAPAQRIATAMAIRRNPVRFICPSLEEVDGCRFPAETRNNTFFE
jgi:hypothetical protein